MAVLGSSLLLSACVSTNHLNPKAFGQAFGIWMTIFLVWDLNLGLTIVQWSIQRHMLG